MTRQLTGMGIGLFMWLIYALLAIIFVAPQHFLGDGASTASRAIAGLVRNVVATFQPAWLLFCPLLLGGTFSLGKLLSRRVLPPAAAHRADRWSFYTCVWVAISGVVGWLSLLWFDLHYNLELGCFLTSVIIPPIVVLGGMASKDRKRFVLYWPARVALTVLPFVIMAALTVAMPRQSRVIVEWASGVYVDITDTRPPMIRP